MRKFVLFFFILGILESSPILLKFREAPLETSTYFGKKGMLLQRAGIFSPQDSPSGNGGAFIELDLQFSKGQSNRTGVDVVIFLSSSQDRIGVDVEDKRWVCCSSSIAENCQGSFGLGRAIIKSNDSATLAHYFSSFDDAQKASIQKVFLVTESGIYYTMILNCGQDLVLVDGSVKIMNPYGHLPSEFYYYLPFYGSVAGVYLLLGLVWLILSLKHRSQLLALQNWIGGVVVFGLIETSAWCFDNLGYNNSGENYIGAMIVGVLFSCVKRTVSRVLVLVVCMGYGVVKPTLGNTRVKVVVLAGLYLLFSTALSIVELVSRTSSNLGVTFLLSFPVAILDTIFYWWVFLSLLGTITQLTQRKQTIKLSMYKRFLTVLIGSALTSSILIVIQFSVVVTHSIDETWRINWLWTACWHLFYLAILVTICIIWRPTSNNTRYAYSEVTEGEVDSSDVSDVSLPLQDLQQRKGRDENQSEIVTLIPPPSFSIDEDEPSGIPSKMD